LMSRAGIVVIDIGTRTWKAGFSGQAMPKVEVNTLVSCPASGEDQSGAFIGQRAFPYPDTEVTDVMQNGIIINWEAAQTLWQHLFDHELQVIPEEYALFLTEPLFSPPTHREKMAEVVFESLGSPGFFVAHQPVLATYAHGRISGLVADLGYTFSQTVPVHEGYGLEYATNRMELAGSQLSQYLMTLLGDMGYKLSSKMPQIVEDIKHECCYVASNYESECQLPPASCTLDFLLPDGKTINLSKERFQCPEVLFNPLPNWNIPYAGIHDMVQRSVNQLQEEIRPEMYQNILLCGGSSLFKGLETRFYEELLQILPPNTDVKVSAMPLRKYSAWIGGSILSSLQNFQTWWIRKHEYDETGPSIIHERCY
ncbi:ACTL9 protein, partial [Todus mexicanus]|nr:ACTL9 protein [Todus mexicanus]